MKPSKTLPAYLSSGEKARLIPVAKESNKEQKATSALLAAIQSVDEFGKGVLSAVGASIGKTSKIECFTEIVFKGDEKEKNSRPDGLIIVKTGSREWRALVEAKVGNNELNSQQIETYIDLARKHKVDAVITISNQTTALLTHHPVTINKNKLKKVGLYHWSWLFLLTEAILWEQHKGLSDPDQAYILSELVRYLQHESTGLLGSRSLKPGWKEVYDKIHAKAPLNRASAEVAETVESWHQLCKYMALDLSLKIGRTVPIHLSKSHQKAQNTRVSDDVEELLQTKTLSCEFSIPDAASHVKFSADFGLRSVTFSMSLKAPKDKTTTKGKIGWLLRQLKNTESKEKIKISATWPSRKQDTRATLLELEEHGYTRLEQENTSSQPTGFEITHSYDLMAKFKAIKSFPEEVATMLPKFYEDIGQYLQEWRPKAPKIVAKEADRQTNSAMPLD